MPTYLQEYSEALSTLAQRIGEIGDLPRIMVTGQCNDAYSAIQVALTLAKAFNCGVNELPQFAISLSFYGKTFYNLYSPQKGQSPFSPTGKR